MNERWISNIEKQTLANLSRINTLGDHDVNLVTRVSKLESLVEQLLVRNRDLRLEAYRRIDLLDEYTSKEIDTLRAEVAILGATKKDI